MGLSPAQRLAVPVCTCVFPALGTQGPCKAAGPASDRATTKSPETSPSSVPFVAVKAQLTSAPVNRTPAKQTCRLWHRSAIKQETSYTGPRHVHSGKKKPHTRGAGRRPQTRACRRGFVFPAPLTRRPRLPCGGAGSARRGGKARALQLHCVDIRKASLAGRQWCRCMSFRK